MVWCGGGIGSCDRIYIGQWGVSICALLSPMSESRGAADVVFFPPKDPPLQAALLHDASKNPLSLYSSPDHTI